MKEIKNYLSKVTDKFNIKNILFDTEVKSLSWKDNKWIIKTDLKKSLLVNTLFVAPVQEIAKTHICQSLKMKKYIKVKLYTLKPGETQTLKTKM